MKVGVFVKRGGNNGGHLWMPVHGAKVAFPLWYLDIPKAGADCLSQAWKLADRKMREMLKFDFPDLPTEVLNKLELDMTKKVLAHSVVAGSVYVYLVGTLKVEEAFDCRQHKQASWMPISKLAMMGSDGKTPRGTVSVSIRMLAHVLKDFLFEEMEIKSRWEGQSRCRQRKTPSRTPKSYRKVEAVVGAGKRRMC